MARDFFKNLPNTTTPLTAPRLNGFLDGDESMGNVVVETIQNKNLFNKNAYNNTGYLNDDGSRSTNSSWIISDYISVNPGEKITISGMSSVGTNPAICFYDSTLTFISGTKHNSINPRTITIPSNCYYIRESVNTNDLSTTQIEKGESASTYSQYQALGYVSGNNDDGYYIKFDNGILICYGDITYTGSRNTSMTTGGYRTSGKTPNFPITFIEAPSINVCDTSGTSDSNGLKCIQKLTDRFTVFWWGINSSSTSTTYYASYIAIGKWK